MALSPVVLRQRLTSTLVNTWLTFINGLDTRVAAVELRGTLPNGYAQVTAAQTGIGSTDVDLTGLSVTVTIGAGRRIRITGYGLVASTVSGDRYDMKIKEGATTIAQYVETVANATTVQSTAKPQVVLSPTAGSHTYKLALVRAGGSGSLTLSGQTDAPAFILVEDIGT